MPLRIRSENTTPLGMLGSFLVAGVLTVGAFRGAWGISSNFALAWWAAAAMFLAGMPAGQLLLIVREFTFDAASQSLTVRERWLGFIRRQPRSISFAEITAVYLQSRTVQK